MHRRRGLAEALDGIGDDVQVAFVHESLDVVSGHEDEIAVGRDSGGENGGVRTSLRSIIALLTNWSAMPAMCLSSMPSGRFRGSKVTTICRSARGYSTLGVRWGGGPGHTAYALSPSPSSLFLSSPAPSPSLPPLHVPSASAPYGYIYLPEPSIRTWGGSGTPPDRAPGRASWAGTVG
jgi:hypothetical protein